MKSILLSVVSLLCNLLTTAQITVPSTTFPALGDTLRYSWAYNRATFDMITPPGFDETWNFTGLTASESIEEIYRSPTQGVYAAKFPEANLLVVDVAGERYYRVTASGLELLGHTEKDLFGYPFTILYKNSVPYKERFAPLNFFDIYQQSTSNLVGFRFAELPAALQATFLSAGLTTMDSIRLRISYSKVAAIDAYGSVTIPGPDPKPAYPVLRQKETQYREGRIDGKIAPLGWLDITDITIQRVPGSSTSLGVDTAGAHIFFNDVTKEEIAHITLDAQGLPHHVRYKTNIPSDCIWTGNANNAWENAANWSCGIVPHTTTNVVINSGTAVINSAVLIRSLKVNPGAMVTVAAGSLTILY